MTKLGAIRLTIGSLVLCVATSAGSTRGRVAKRTSQAKLSQPKPNESKVDESPLDAVQRALDFLGEWQSCYGDARRGERHDNRRVPEQTLQVLRGEGHPVTLSLGTGLQNSVETLGIRPSHFKGQHSARHQFRHRPHRAFGQWPWYGYYDVPPYTSDYDMTFSTPETAVVAPTQPTVGCQHSE